jgi:hypothetical protein
MMGKRLVFDMFDSKPDLKRHPTLGEEVLKEVMSLVSSGFTGRGLSRFSKTEDFLKALKLLLSSEKPLIITGFFVAEAGAAETDGPMGAAVLGRALKALGKRALIATDWRCRGVTEAASFALKGPKVFIVSKPKHILRFNPDLLIFIERPGRARDGRYYNMRGIDITDVTDPLDDALSLAGDFSLKVRSLGIGDGGNEAGMGNFLQKLALSVPEFGRCLSVVKSDGAIACDVSNWGCYGLVALLSCLLKKDLLHDEEEELHMMLAMLDAKALDGKTLERSPFVDGLPLSLSQKLVSRLRELIQKYIKEGR